jgi:hypothetical protein
VSDHAHFRDCNPGKNNKMSDDDETLELLARIAILAGKLPGGRIQRIWGGQGEGCHCSLCGGSVDRGEPGYEFDVTGEAAPGNTCALHFRCFAAWNSARDRLERHASTRGADRRSGAGQRITQ